MAAPTEMPPEDPVSLVLALPLGWSGALELLLCRLVSESGDSLPLWVPPLPLAPCRLALANEIKEFVASARTDRLLAVLPVEWASMYDFVLSTSTPTATPAPSLAPLASPVAFIVTVLVDPMVSAPATLKLVVPDRLLVASDVTTTTDPAASCCWSAAFQKVPAVSVVGSCPTLLSCWER